MFPAPLRAVLPILIAAAVLLAGCGSPRPSAPEDTPGLAVQSQADPFELLAALQEKEWRYSDDRSLGLPPKEASYPPALDAPAYTEYAYYGGALRLLVAEGSVFTILADTRHPAFGAYRNLASTDQYAVGRALPWVAVVPLPADARPGYEAFRTSPAEDAEAFGVRQAGRLRELEAVLSAGRPSPGGTYRAALVSGSGPYENWLYIQRPDRAPLRVDGFDGILDFHWLDDHRLVYTTARWGVVSHGFYVVDAARTRVEVKAWAPPGITAFGVVGPDRIWYETSTGQRGELPLDGSARPPTVEEAASASDGRTSGEADVSRNVPALLSLLDAQGWDLNFVTPLLPPPEERYDEIPAGTPTHVMYAYQGGALRFVVGTENRILAVIVDTRHPDYADFGRLAGTDRHLVRSSPPYVAVVPAAPLSPAVYEALAARDDWSQEELDMILGGGSFRLHTPSWGRYHLFYIPQGLEFEQREFDSLYRLARTGLPESNTPPPPGVAYPVYRSQLVESAHFFGGDLAAKLSHMEAAFAERGVPSPDGRYRAVVISGSRDYDKWVYVRRPGQAEVRVCAYGEVQAVAWLDDRRLVFATTDGAFTVVDAATGASYKATQVQHPGGLWIRAIRVIDPGRVWYQTQDGQWYDLLLPPPK